MNAASTAKIVLTVASAFVVIVGLMMWVLYRRRRQLVDLNYSANGRVVDIQEKRATRDKYYVSLVEYTHHKKGKTTLQRFSYRRPRRYTKGGEVSLYYHPEFPEKFALKEDTTTRVSLIILGVLAGIVAGVAIGIASYLVRYAYV